MAHPGRILLVAIAAAATCVLATGRARSQTEPLSPRDKEYPLDVDLDDRVDPVRPGDEMVFEVEVENFTDELVPDVVLTIEPPAGTSFVVAHREPDWHEVAGQQVGDAIELDLGVVTPCDQPPFPRCHDLWVTLQVDPDVEPGTVLETTASITSSDVRFPPNEATTYTSVGSAAVRRAKVFVGRPLRDRVQVQLDLARAALRTRLDPPPPMVDVAHGIHLTLGERDAPPLLDVTVGPDELRCTNPYDDPGRAKTCGLRNARAFRELGLQRLQIIQRPYLAVQRNNALVRLQGAFLDIPRTTGHEFEITLETGDETYHDAFVVEDAPSGRYRRYNHPQGEP